jgi:CubicO group peptidase (beta-lactamase class C family)
MNRTGRIQSLLNDAASNAEVPGVAVAAVLPDGEVVTAAAGVRDAGTGAKMTPDTVVWIASMTKALTAAAAMQLVEQGRLELDAPVARVLPQLASPQVLEGFDAANKPKLRPAKSPITLRHLLTHTNGMVYHIWNDDILKYLEVTQTPDITQCKNACLNLPLVFDPGTAWNYGIGIDWAGKAVEAVSGQRLGQYMQQNLLGPLGMRDTAFRIGPEQRKRLAKIHMRGETGGFTASEIEIPQEPEFEMGGGGLYVTVGDYLRFVRMILGGGALDGVRVLKAETVQTMSANAMGPIACVPMKTAIAGLSHDVDFIAGMKWGLSFLINPAPLPTGRSAGSLAWAGLANSFFWIDPARRVGGVYATQLLPFADPRALDLFGRFEAETYAMA